MRARAALLLSIPLLAAAGEAAAQPARQTLSPEQVRAQLGRLGLVQQEVLPRADGLRAVRLMLSVPPGPAPASGWPVVYLLDGNAAMQALAERDRGDLTAGVVLVGIGYDTNERVDGDARAWDYLPALPGAGPQGTPDPRNPLRRNGGAADWRAFIENEVKPWATRHAPIDPARQTLYGHSYGGLFVLDTLFTAPGSFQRFVAASPSMWWQAPYMMDRAREYVAAPRPGPAPEVVIMVGDAEHLRKPIPGAPAAEIRQVPAGQAAGLAGLLRTRDPEVAYITFPGLTHGPMLPASAERAVEIAADRPATQPR